MQQVWRVHVFLEELVSRGHYVKAIARNTHKVPDTEHVLSVDVDLNDHEALVEALKGQDAVISAVPFHGLDANALINTIRDSKVKRYFGCWWCWWTDYSQQKCMLIGYG